MRRFALLYSWALKSLLRPPTGRIFGPQFQIEPCSSDGIIAFDLRDIALIDLKSKQSGNLEVTCNRVLGFEIHKPRGPKWITFRC